MRVTLDRVGSRAFARMVLELPTAY
jgi:hypothetical protein